PLEQKSAQILKEWRFKLERSVFSPSVEDLEPMAIFLAMQYLRTPKARRRAVAMNVLAAQIDFYNFLGRKAPEFARTIKNPFEELPMTVPEEKWAHVHATQLIDRRIIEEIAGLLMNHIWLVTENKTQWSLYTSDHPLVQTPTLKH